MGSTLEVAYAGAAFVGTHFLLSHPLRAPLVARIGERGFLIAYSLVAFATLGWMVAAYRAAPVTAPFWTVGDGFWGLATILMLAASVLLMGSLIRNPALPTGGAAPVLPDAPRGVFAVTRHPMMWSFAIWGLSHILVYPVAANIVVAGTIIVLALAGAWFQDRKKAALEPGIWPRWEAMTSYWPFLAILRGKARFGGFGMHGLAGGLIVWLVATWAHQPLAGWAAGIWRWL